MAIADNIARMLFRAAAGNFSRSGWSFNQAYRTAVDWGWSYRRTNMLTDWNSINGLVKGWTRAKNVSPTAKFPQKNMFETDLSRDYKYRVHGFATYQNQATGEEFKKEISMYTDRWLSLDTYQNEFEKWKEKEQYETGLSVVSTDFQMVEHNSGFTY